MIIVTGGAGFIGSNIIKALEEQGYYDTIVCDWLGTDAKWKNIAKRELGSIIQPNEIFPFLSQNASRIEAIIHMGAISTTTETNVDACIQNNFRLSQGLWSWCATNKKRFIYASSAATYGDGSKGFSDQETPEHLSCLQPLNPYGWTKHLFDRWLARMNQTNVEKPTKCVGLKFFNVFGPNEYHKEGQKSVACALTKQIQDGNPARLFKSNHTKYKDGGQMRDFVYVKDCVDVITWLLETPDVNGLFNVGSGEARSFKELAESVFKSMGYDAPRIEYVDMPDQLKDKYQNFTQADMAKLRDAGYEKRFTPLEEAVADYVRNYLLADDPYA